MTPNSWGMPHHAITDELVAALSREADADERSITRALAGLPVRGRAGARIARALAAHGLVRADSNATPPHVAA